MFWERDIFDEMQRMQHEMDRIFQRSFGFGPEAPLLGYGKDDKHAVASADARKDFWRMPKADAYETENSIIATFELPGVDKKDIELNVTSSAIEVKVEKKQEKNAEDREKGTHSYMRRSTSFYRCLPFNKEVKSDDAKAEYKNGMLRVEIPKAKKEKPKRIEVH
ncbi:Hsp20/alpha crystallin family protein [Candidatus Woesearchaeota archaeon]|nr:Hsp20/alpha crystallin family protein [Candidatus Woesearchaeota archaeon]